MFRTWLRYPLAGAAIAALALACVASPELVAATPPPAARVSLVGHGLGHGAGMGQWGALGYAVNGYSYESILSHYYGGTTMAKVPNRPIRVILTSNDRMDTVVTSTSPFRVAGHAFAPGRVARMHLLASGAFALSEGDSCGAKAWTPVATLSAGQAVAVPSGPNPTMGVCGPSGSTTYRGDIEAVAYKGQARTVNVVTLEDYLRGVVPAESPPYWGTLGKQGRQGQPGGFQELEAQAVAARSFVMSAFGQYGFADICDSPACQAYRGVGVEGPTTDRAVADSAGEVLQLASGKVAATQYSASTGGYTAGGAFPAVPDTGDAICLKAACNPDHSWSADVPVATVDSAYPSIGVLKAITVTKRNGLGDLGGRVEALTLLGTKGHVDVSGDAFASALGLKSNWFAVESVGVPRKLVGDRVIDSTGDVADAGAAAYHGSAPGEKLPVVGAAGSPDGGGYWLLDSGGDVRAFGDAHLYSPATAPHPSWHFVGMAPTPNGRGYWLTTAGGGVYTFGDASFHGSLGGKRLAHPIAAIAPTPDGGGYWLVSTAGQLYTFGDAHDHGSTAPLHLPMPIVGMAPTPDGGGYWLLESNGGVFSFGDATYSGSLPGLGISQLRATALVPTPDGGGYLVGTTKGVVYHFGDAPSLPAPAPRSPFHPPAVSLLGVTAPQA
ncbi:MAG: SpoIID/LytB domain-containing protein [Acidimicrobiales bacterium]